MKSSLFALALLSTFAAQPALAQTGPRVAHQPSARAPLSAAIQTGDIFWLSGKLGANAETRAMTSGRTAAETRNIMEAFGELLTELGLGFENIVQGTVYLTDIADFQEMNEVYGEYFPRDPPARVTVAVSGLVGGATIEISFVAVRD
jgi:2-iminobutanoate/2-iminopropanoate deaminase